MIVGVSPAIRRGLVVAERYARTRLPILLVGATGTGKELFARHIHERSGRPGPLVDVNCCALPRDMVESLLFGHRRGGGDCARPSSLLRLEQPALRSAVLGLFGIPESLTQLNLS